MSFRTLNFSLFLVSSSIASYKDPLEFFFGNNFTVHFNDLQWVNIYDQPLHTLRNLIHERITKIITSILLCFIVIAFHIFATVNKAMTPRMYTFRKSYLPYPCININKCSIMTGNLWSSVSNKTWSPLDHLQRILLFLVTIEKGVISVWIKATIVVWHFPNTVFCHIFSFLLPTFKFYAYIIFL